MTPLEVEKQVDATAATLGLPIAAAYRAGVLRYFGIAADMAALVMAQPLSVDDEPAEVFVPVGVTAP